MRETTSIVSVKLVEDWGQRKKGTVMEVDSVRAAWLVERGYVRMFDPESEKPKKVPKAN